MDAFGDALKQWVARLPRHATALALLVVLFVSANLFANITFRHARLDLTENGLFTLSDGARNILGRLEEPVTLRFYHARGAMTDYPNMQVYAQRVRDMLEEMTAAANGNLVLEIVEPEAFSESEDLAVQQGLVAQPAADGSLIYFGLVGTNLVDNVEVIPFFSDERQEYLEYDLIRMVANLDQPRKPVLGVLSNLPLDTGAGGIMAAMQGLSQPFLIYSELVDRFEVSFLPQQMARIPSNIDVLLLAHPRPLSEPTIYAIDQFAMRGGRIIAFIDPYSEVSLTAGPNGQPLQGYTENSNLPRLMASWGVSMADDAVLVDRANAQRVQTGQDARREVQDYIAWLALGPDAMNDDDLITGNIDSLNLGSVGVLRPTEDATTSFTPLVSSSQDAAIFARDFVRGGPTPGALLRAFEADGQAHVIAARLTGRLNTAFPDGPPSTAAPAAGQPLPASPGEHLATHPMGNIIVFADSDVFDDRFWVSEQNYLGQRFGVPIADNAKFLLNAVENLMGSNDLISLRGRERAVRPFTRVAALRRTAEARFLQEEEALSARLGELQAELDTIENQGANIADAAALSTRYRNELVETRKALRDVQASLRRDIERLGVRVTWINILLMPAFVVAFAFVMAARRRAQRIATQRAGGFKIHLAEPDSDRGI